MEPASYTHAAVMGDLVDSEGALSRAALHATFNAAVDAVNAACAARLASPLTITLGDEFQGLCAGMAEGLGIVRDLRTRLLLRGVECRFTVGAVRLSTPVNADRAWSMMGEGLAETRASLTGRRTASAYRFVAPGQPTVQLLMEAVGAELTDIERGWTRRQREVILLGLSQDAAALAARLETSVQNIYQVRRSGRFEAYERQWKALAAGAAHLDRVYGLAG